MTLCTEEEPDDFTSADYDPEHNIDGVRFDALAESDIRTTCHHSRMMATQNDSVSFPSLINRPLNKNFLREVTVSASTSKGDVPRLWLVADLARESVLPSIICIDNMNSSR